MRVHFSSLTIAPPFRAALDRNGIHVVSDADDADLAFYPFSGNAAAPNVGQARRIAVVEPALLDDEKAFGALLTAEGFEDWIPRDRWEQWFWLSLRRFAEALRDRGLLEGALARQAALETELLALFAHAEKQLPQAEHALSVARGVQRRLLERFSPKVPGFFVQAKYLPGKGSGGDYYDFFELEEGRRFAILVADATSHSMAACLLAALLPFRADEVAEKFPTAREFAEGLAKGILEAKEPPRGELSLLVAYLDRTTLRLEWASCGTLAPWYVPHGMTESPQAIPTATAMLRAGGKSDFRDGDLQLRPGDAFLFVTGGLDALAGTSAHGGIAKLLTRSGEGYDPVELQNELVSLVQEKNGELPDDVTLLQFRVDRKALYRIS